MKSSSQRYRSLFAARNVRSACTTRTARAARTAKWSGLAFVALASFGCKDDLPQQQLTGQQGAAAAPATGAAAAPAAGNVAAPAAGTPGGTATGTPGAAPPPASGAAGTAASGDTGAAAASGGTPASGGAAGQSGPAVPPGQVVAACMGRAGETVCDGEVQILCGESATAESRQNCKTEAQCLAGIPAGKCGSCDPGDVRCTDADLEECNMAGEFEVKEACPSAALCSEENKSCDPAGCEEGAYDCDDQGNLTKCAEDRTMFEVDQPCGSPELCDAAGKKCNVCTPNTATCEDEATLVTCSSDGTMMMSAPCADPTAKCAMMSNKCVQCLMDEDCMPSNECMDRKCDTGTGMCTEETPKPSGTMCSAGKCDTTGACVECVEMADCGESDRCLLGSCVPRFALEVTPLLNGRFSVNVSPGFGVSVSGTGDLSSVRLTTALNDTCSGSVDGCTVDENDTGEVATISVTGPSGAYCGLNGLLAGDSVTLGFQLLASEEGMLPTCSDARLTLRAN